MTDQLNLSTQHGQSFAPPLGLNQPESAQGQWMSLQEASNATGFSMATLRRYIKRRRIKSRRMGRALNAKVEVLVTPELLNSEDDDRISADGFDDILQTETVEGIHEDDQADQATYATRETFEWLKHQLEDKEAQLQEILRDKDAQIERLTEKLVGASYRNGYLESQQSTYENQIKLLTDNQPKPAEPQNWWARMMRWLAGAPQ